MLPGSPGEPEGPEGPTSPVRPRSPFAASRPWKTGAITQLRLSLHRVASSCDRVEAELSNQSRWPLAPPPPPLMF